MARFFVNNNPKSNGISNNNLSHDLHNELKAFRKTGI